MPVPFILDILIQTKFLTKTFMKKFISISILFVLLLNGCTQQVYQKQFYVFGTLVGVSIWGVSTEEADTAVDVIIKDLQLMHHQWHAWDPSPLTDLNQAMATGKSGILTDTALLIQAQQLYTLSDGLFNPAIGQLISLWGFHKDDLSHTQALPSQKQISALVALNPRMDDIQIENNQVLSHNRAVQLDFGAFAKGYAIDRAIKTLRQLGIQNAIINAGGNLKAMGKKGDTSWVIGIRHPSGSGILGGVVLNGEESVITSGNYERFREYQGVRYSHIIDPRTGNPAKGLSSVTVIAQSGALADAASTALTIAGLKDWHRIARQMGIKYVMLVDDAGIVYVNPAMAKRVQFPAEQVPTIVVSEPL